MIHIRKNKTPEFLVEYIRKNPSADYDNESFKEYYRPLREELIKEQKGLCAYCCSRITPERSHNEHIEPRHMQDGTKSKRSLDYRNIVASCNNNATCGKHKDNIYDEKRFVSPLQDNCTELFSYDPSGNIYGDEYTISLLNLNSFDLRQARKSVYKSILYMTEEEIRLGYCSNIEIFEPFSNVVFWYLKNIIGRGNDDES